MHCVIPEEEKIKLKLKNKWSQHSYTRTFASFGTQQMFTTAFSKKPTTLYVFAIFFPNKKKETPMGCREHATAWDYGPLPAICSLLANAVFLLIATTLSRLDFCSSFLFFCVSLLPRFSSHSPFRQFSDHPLHWPFVSRVFVNTIALAFLELPVYFHLSLYP